MNEKDNLSRGLNRLDTTDTRKSNVSGLTAYLRKEGQTPSRMFYANLNFSPEKIQNNLNSVFKFRGSNDPDVYYDEVSRVCCKITEVLQMWLDKDLNDLKTRQISERLAIQNKNKGLSNGIYGSSQFDSEN